MRAKRCASHETVSAAVKRCSRHRAAVTLRLEALDCPSRPPLVMVLPRRCSRRTSCPSSSAQLPMLLMRTLTVATH